jgi:23S rRNA (adenine2503-C2)-methyltransferase
MEDYSNIYDLSYEELSRVINSWGEPEFRVDQIWQGVYQHLWSSPSDFSMLPKALRQKISDIFALNDTLLDNKLSFSQLNATRTQSSYDGETIKTLFTLRDGIQLEAVHMKYKSRHTLCISTQAGCAMGCVFCATGQMGFHRHLSSGEIIEQVLYYARLLSSEHMQLTNIVIMGMGEPFHNYEATLSAIKRLNSPKGFNLGARRFTISTVGLVPEIRRFTKEKSQINLAISLHAADDLLRSQLLPINRKYPLDQLFSACLEYIQKTHRRLSFEWALIEGVNDTPEQAHLLIQRLIDLRIGGSNLSHVNVIPLNPTEKYLGHPASRKNALAFQDKLALAGIPCTIRLRRGIEIQAGCGQLAIKSKS